MEELVTFDDITLIPRYSDIKSIKDISITSRMGHANLDLLIPVISSPMDTVTGIEMQKAMFDGGALGVHHRYNVDRDTLVEASKQGAIAVSPSMTVEEIHKIVKQWEADRDTMIPDMMRDVDPFPIHSSPILCIDIAHGDSEKGIELAKELVKFSAVISGNIATGDAALRYYDAGVRIFRVGIGPGSACSTRVKTGFGIPQVSALGLVHTALKNDGVRNSCFIISDGGVNHVGDIAKALACGADAVMSGRLFAGTEEANGPTYRAINGMIYPTKTASSRTAVRTSLPDGYYKRYRGMASKEALSEAGKTVREEGVAGWVPYAGPVSDVLLDIKQSLQAAFNYCGASNMHEFKENVRMARISQNSVREAHPRI